VRQNLYTCCRCGKEMRAPSSIEDAPLGWAIVTFERDSIDGTGDDRQLTRQSLTTHACAVCSTEVLAFLEPASSREDVDCAFDDGGAAP